METFAPALVNSCSNSHLHMTKISNSFVGGDRSKIDHSSSSNASVNSDKQFLAAVKIVQSLPKEGSFTPSNDLKLKFYAYYKQATLGPCTQMKPAFWDIVNKAKWEAWHCLGTMTPSVAMQNYVDSIKDVIESMPMNEEVESFYSVEMSQLADQYQCLTGKEPVVNGHVPNGNAFVENDVCQPYLPESQFDETAVKTILSESPSEEEVFADANEGVLEPEPEVENVQFDATETAVVPPAVNVPEAAVRNSPPKVSFLSPHRPALHSRQPKFGKAVKLDVKPFLPPVLIAGDHSDLQANCFNYINRSIVEINQIESSRKDCSSDEKMHLRQLLLGENAKYRRASGRAGELNGIPRTAQTHERDSNGTSSNSSTEMVHVDRSGSASGRRGRNGSRSSGSSSSSVEIVDFDPQVSAVLLNMHRDLRAISRQLELLKNVLLAQQQLIQTFVNKPKKVYRLGVFPDLPWRTIFFIIVWPILANILVRRIGSKGLLVLRKLMTSRRI